LDRQNTAHSAFYITVPPELLTRHQETVEMCPATSTQRKLLGPDGILTGVSTQWGNLDRLMVVRAVMESIALTVRYMLERCRKEAGIWPDYTSAIGVLYGHREDPGSSGSQLFPNSFVRFVMRPHPIVSNLCVSTKEPWLVKELNRYLKFTAHLAEASETARFFEECIQSNTYPKEYWKVLRGHHIDVNWRSLKRHSLNQLDTYRTQITQFEKNAAQMEYAQ
uniref:RNA-dependent RNA polymerase n=1 Tax=Echinostoma caproni TaxID=27848 RepID=A0A183A907_9TREM